MAETQHSVRIVKTFPYRDIAVQHWSNRYFFDGPAPANQQAWYDLFDGLVLLEKTVIASDCTIVAAHGYQPGSDIGVANKTYSVAGTFAPGTKVRAPGDAAIVARMATSKRSTKNKPVYLYSYFHDVWRENGVGYHDTVATNQKAAVEAYMDAWLTGIIINGRTYKRTTPDGVLATGRFVSPYIGHRDFPR